MLYILFIINYVYAYCLYTQRLKVYNTHAHVYVCVQCIYALRLFVNMILCICVYAYVTVLPYTLQYILNIYTWLYVYIRIRIYIYMPICIYVYNNIYFLGYTYVYMENMFVHMYVANICVYISVFEFCKS